MKLCKDCKHVAMPHPLAQLAQYSSAAPIYRPMCGHPDARRSVVDGSLETTCVNARGVNGATHLSICGPDAKLFEYAPPPEPKTEPMPYQIFKTWEPPPSWWERLQRWLD